MQVPSAVKDLLKRTVYQEGRIRTVLWGPCRGLRYRIFPEYGWSYLYGGWEKDNVRIIQKYVQPGFTVYDLGANYGMHTLLFARLAGSSGRIYAFEPNPQVFSALEEQLALNRLPSVKLVRKAVTSYTGTAAFEVADHTATGHLVTDQGGEFTVETTTLDDFVFTGHASPPDFIKIDIEGAESEALRGATHTLQQYRPKMLIELHNPVQDRAVGTILKNLDYQAFRTDGSMVAAMDSGWPDPHGMSGTVLAVPR